MGIIYYWAALLFMRFFLAYSNFENEEDLDQGAGSFLSEIFCSYMFCALIWFVNHKRKKKTFQWNRVHIVLKKPGMQ
jgi:hypothetical protein